MSGSLFSMKLTFYSINIFSIIIFSLLFQIFCNLNETPKEISENYFQINLLSSGQSFTFNINKIFIICSYNSDFSDKIKIINKNDQKYILCFTHSLSNSYLYIINNVDTYLYKFDFNLDYNISIIPSLNLFPFVDKNNNLSFIMNFFQSKNNLGYVDKYIINIKDLEVRKEKRFVLNDQILNNAHGYLNSEISNEYVACCMINNNCIYSYMYIDESNRVILNNITCQIFSDKVNLSKSEISYSYYINKEQNLIFICYKYNGTKTYCYFYNLKNNSFIYNYNELECENNINNYYFKETNKYALVCQNSNSFNIYLLDGNNLSQNFTCATIYIYGNHQNLSHNLFLHYNSSYNEYNLIDNAYDNYKNEFIKNNYSINNNDFNNIFIQHRKLQIYWTLDSILVDIPTYMKSRYKTKSVDYNNLGNYNFIIKESNVSSPGVTDLQFEECLFFLQFYHNYIKFIYFIMEIMDNTKESLNHKVEYKIFDENFKEVNISICKDFYGVVKYSLNRKIDIDIDEIREYKRANANLFNITDEFFTELCKVYHELDYDVILEDRIKDLYKKYYVCEEGCYFEDVDENYVYCQCKIKQNISLENRKIEFKDEVPTYYPKAIEVFKCLFLVFSSDDKINNIGFYLFTFMLGSHIPIWCYYISTGVKPMEDYITGEMTKFGYITKRKKSKVIKIKRNNKMRKSAKIQKKKKISDINVANLEKEEDDNKNKITSSPPPKNQNNENEEKDEKKVNKRKLKRNKSLVLGTSFVIKNNDKKQKKQKSVKYQHSIDREKSDNSKNIIKNSSSSKSIPEKLMETDIKDEEFYYGGESKPKNYDDFNFITIDVSQTEYKKNNKNRKESKKILNNYSYEEAIELDKRSFCQILYIFLLSKDIVFHTFLLGSPFDSLSVLATNLIFTVGNDLFFNCILYTNVSISKRFKTKMSIFPFTFKYNMGYIISATIIVYIIIFFIGSMLNLSTKIGEVFKKEENKIRSDKKYVVKEERKVEIEQEIKKILETQSKKNIAFFIIEIFFMLIYWYYVTAFCHVFTNTQTTLILDTFFSIVFRFVIDCLLCFVLSIVYKYAVTNKSETVYKCIMFIYNH